MKVWNLCKMLLPCVAVFSLSAVFFYFDTFFVMENQLSHSLLKEPRKLDRHIKLVAVDKQSLDVIGRWPWPRDVMATTVEKLLGGGARAVFVDVIYDTRSPRNQEDEAWRRIVSQYSNIYLPTYFDLKKKQNPQEPLVFDSSHYPIYPLGKDQIGHINTLMDDNRVVTKIQLGIWDQGDMVPAMDVRLANLLLSPDMKISWNAQNQWYRGKEELPSNPRGEVLFAYATYPQDEGIDVIPIVELIKGKVDPAYFKDCLVLIGPYAAEFQDLHYTPMSKNVLMNGIEIHANAIQALLDDKLYQRTVKSTGFYLLALLSFISFISFRGIGIRGATIFLFPLIFLYELIVIVLFYTQHIIMPVFYPFLCISMAYLASVLFHYQGELRERKRITSMFGRYVSPGVVKQIMSSPEGMELGGIRMEVSILFIDIRGFTRLSDQMEAERVIEILNEYLALSTEAIFSQGGTLDKFMGDGVMAIFGAPIVQEDHAIRAITTALLIKEKFQALAERTKAEYAVTMQLGMGIHSGPVVIGNIGSHQRLEYTAIGDTVNVASRMESHAEPGHIIISDAAYRLAYDRFHMMDLEPIFVKGKPEPIKIYEPLYPKLCVEQDRVHGMEVTD